MSTKETGISDGTARLSRRQTLGWGAALTAAAMGALPPVQAQEPAAGFAPNL